LSSIIDFILNIDAHLLEFAQMYGEWIYGLLFVIVFAETGCVVTPFLPGDSLLFAAGALAGIGVLDPVLTGGLIFAAAVLGDAVNYSIGRRIGPKIFHATDTRGWFHKLLNRKHLARAHEFFERYGGRAVVLGRFVPIVRTFVPFVAGAAQMSRGSFVLYNFTGAFAWVLVCFGAGLAFGNVPVVKNNFEIVTIGIVFVSILPMIIEILRAWTRSTTPPPAGVPPADRA
jgi:membrane-associated protein